MPDEHVQCEAAVSTEGCRGERANTPLTSTSATQLSLDQTSQHVRPGSQPSQAPSGPSAPPTPKGKQGNRSESRRSQVNAGANLTQQSIKKSSPKFPSSWSPAWYEACAKTGILPEDLLERSDESFFATPGATDNIIAMRREHYEQRRKERLDIVSAAFLEAESSRTSQTVEEIEADELHEGSTVGELMSPEERRKSGMMRRMKEMRDAAERAATLEVERKKAKQAQQLQAALSAENVRQEKLQAMERKKQLQRQKEALRQQEHARLVALAKEREEEIQVARHNNFVVMMV